MNRENRFCWIVAVITAVILLAWDGMAYAEEAKAPPTAAEMAQVWDQKAQVYEAKVSEIDARIYSLLEQITNLLYAKHNWEAMGMEARKRQRAAQLKAKAAAKGGRPGKPER